VGEIWAAIGVSTTLTMGVTIFLFTNLSSRIQQLSARMDGIEGRFDGVNARFDGVNARLDGTNARIDGVLEMLATHLREHR
jgi:hypothetical protein